MAGFDIESSDEPGISVHYAEQFLSSSKNRNWETSIEYPAKSSDCQELVDQVQAQRKLSEKPLRVIKVTVKTEIIAVFD